MRTSLLSIACIALSLAACDSAAVGSAAAEPEQAALTPPLPLAIHVPSPTLASAQDGPPASHTMPPQRIPDPPFVSAEVARFDQPWAMAFLPDGRLLVTEKTGRLRLLNIASRQTTEISGVPAVAYGGQGGLGDVALHPQFAGNGLIYLTYAEAGSGDTRGAAMARARLVLDPAGNGGRLEDLRVIWRQVPKVSGSAHYSHRMLFGKDGKLWLSSGERQKASPAQDLQSNLGKILRLNDDGSTPPDNPFANQGSVAAQVWSYGHRNVLGLAFDAGGRLWAHEMGPAGGDELNLIERGSNYGWPIVSNGDNYDGSPIPDHDTRPEFNAPEISWSPVIAPAGFIIYTGELFPYFWNRGFIGGLASQALIQVDIGGSPREMRRYPMGHRIREVEQGPDGAIWLLEDGADARLLKLTPNRG